MEGRAVEATEVEKVEERTVVVMEAERVEVEKEVDSIYNLIYCLRTSILDHL